MPREATCIRCGCTASDPCPGGCSWIWVDYEKGEGVCTSCSPLLPAEGGIQAASPLDDCDVLGLLPDEEEGWDDD